MSGSGGRLAGRAHGVDYLRVHADDRIEFDLHLTIENEIVYAVDRFTGGLYTLELNL